MKYLHLIFFLFSFDHSFAQDSVDQLSKKYTEQAQEGLIRLHTRHREELTKIQNAAMELKDLTLANKANTKIRELDDEISKLGGAPSKLKTSVTPTDQEFRLFNGDLKINVNKDNCTFTARGNETLQIIEFTRPFPNNPLGGSIARSYNNEGGASKLGKPLKGEVAIFSNRYMVHICSKSILVWDYKLKIFDKAIVDIE